MPPFLLKADYYISDKTNKRIKSQLKSQKTEQQQNKQAAAQ